MIKNTAVLSPIFNTSCSWISWLEKLYPVGTFTSRVPVVSFILKVLPRNVYPKCGG